MMAGLFCGCSESRAAPRTQIVVPKDRVAVVYFSWSPDGNTRFAAENIGRWANARIFEIKAKKTYSSNFKECCDEAKPECYGKKLRPILPLEGFDVGQYDVIFVGTPNWWGTMAPPVRTFLTENASAMRGKIVCLFQTNGGGGMQRCGEEFAQLLPESKILPPRAFVGSLVHSNVAELERFVSDRIVVK